MFELRNLLNQVLLRLDGQNVLNLQGQTIAQVKGRQLVNLHGQILGEVEQGRVLDSSGGTHLEVKGDDVFNRYGQKIASVAGGTADEKAVLQQRSKRFAQTAEVEQYRCSFGGSGRCRGVSSCLILAMLRRGIGGS